MRRPAAVTAAVAAMLGLIALGFVNSALVLSYKDTQLTPSATDTDVEMLNYVIAGTIFASLVPSVLFALLAAFVLHGRQWARVTTWVTSGVLLLCGSCAVLGSSLRASYGVGGWLGTYAVVYPIAVVVLLVAVVVLLALPPSNKFFAQRRYERNLR